MLRRPRFQLHGLLLAAGLLLLPVNLGGAADESSTPLLSPDRIKTDLLVILAHPDDEGVVAPLLAREALEAKRRVVALYLTSGRFGTNRVGSVRGPAFGYLRMAELHWTLDRLGVAMFYSLDRPDRAGSADPEEVLRAWDRERTIRELVRFIRLLRPSTVITWFPGPAASHVDHVATGGAALLACRAAASREAFPEQMEREGLRPWKVERILLAYQAEKVAYARYPSSVEEIRAAGATVEEIDLDLRSPLLGSRYTDIAREALREQRAVGAAANLGRGGPFDEPLRLIQLPAAGEVSPIGSGITIRLRSRGAQAFLDRIAADVEVPALAGWFWPEARIDGPEGETLAWGIRNRGTVAQDLRAKLELPAGWKSRPGKRELTLAPGGSSDLSFQVNRPGKGSAGFVEGSLILERSSGEAAARSRFVLRVPPGDDRP